MLFVILLHSSCKTTKYVPEGKHLLVENTIDINGDELNNDQINAVIRQKPNLKLLGIRFRLKAFNAIDSTKLTARVSRMQQRIILKNNKAIAKANRINEQRIIRAKQKNKPYYRLKKAHIRDTVEMRQKIGEKIKFNFGEAPVIADTLFLNKSVKQIESYIRNKGYYYGNVTAHFDTISNRKKRVKATYSITTGPRYFIDSIQLAIPNASLEATFKDFVRKVSDKEGFNTQLENHWDKQQRLFIPFDAENLSLYRIEAAKHFRDASYYGFNEESISFDIDTNKRDMRMRMNIQIADRIVQSKVNNDSIVTLSHQKTKVVGVFFHICDTTLYSGNFKQQVDYLGRNLRENKMLVTLDSLHFMKIKRKVELPISERTSSDRKEYQKSVIEKNLIGQFKDSVGYDLQRVATFTYNGELFVHPDLLEAQNYLENQTYYKEFNLERTYNRLVQLGLFQSIFTDIVETDLGSGQVEVHYYLIPTLKKAFSFEPRANNFNGYLGVSTSLNYSNKNILKTGTNMVFSFSGGFETSPLVFGEDSTAVIGDNKKQTFNTFEVGPSLKYDIPGLFPFGINALKKRQRPRTIISGAFNFQRRTDFNRKVFQFNYGYKFALGNGNTQSVSLGLPGMSVVKVISINKSAAFQSKINDLNDLFLRNAYSNQLIWEDFRIQFDYDNLLGEHRFLSKNIRLTFSGSVNTAGNLLSLLTSFGPQKDSLVKKIGDVPFSQFSMLDTKLIVTNKLSKRKSIAFKFLGGVGLPGKNTKTSLPFDYSFFGGGSNDNRGWVARSLGPGSYSILLDSNNVLTQIADIRLSSSLEIRFGGGKLVNHAFFIDAGNIWTMNYDPNRPGSQISKNWYKEIGLSIGYGLRLDFDYFIARLDFGLPIYNPGLPIGSRWIYESKEAFNTAALNYYGSEWKTRIPASLFLIQPHFGIGFPF